jgi:hypothetical protein
MNHIIATEYLISLSRYGMRDIAETRLSYHTGRKQRISAIFDGFDDNTYYLLVLYVDALRGTVLLLMFCLCFVHDSIINE